MRSPFIACGISLALLVLAVAGYATLRGAVAGKSVTVADLAGQIEAKGIESKRLVSVRERLSALADDEAAVKSYFIPETGVVSFIDALQARGQALDSSVEITSVAATPASATSRPLLLVALSITGSFDAVLRTLGSIEYAPYALSVTSLTFAKNASDATWVANVNVSVGSTAQSDTAPITPSILQVTPTSTSTSTSTSTPTSTTATSAVPDATSTLSP